MANVFDPTILNATPAERTVAFEWLRKIALAGGPDWRKAAIAAEEWSRLSNGKLLPPTEDEVSAYRDLFRAKLDKNMALQSHCASPSTDAHRAALTEFIKARNAASEKGRTLAQQVAQAVVCAELCRECRPSGRCIKTNPVYQNFAREYGG